MPLEPLRERFTVAVLRHLMELWFTPLSISPGGGAGGGTLEAARSRARRRDACDEI